MNNIFLIAKYAVKELSSKKIIWFFFGISVLVIGILLLVFNSLNLNDILPLIKFKGKHQEITNASQLASMFFKTAVTMPLFGGGLFLSIFAVSGLIPSILEKGTVEFFLSRPIKRYELLWGEFLGGTFVIFLNISFLVISTWLIIGAYLGDWGLHFLIIIPLITLAFMVFYSIIILMGIKWQSSVAAMMTAYLIFIALSPILHAKDTVLLLLDGALWKYLITGLYYIIPQTADLAGITAFVALGKSVNSILPVLVTFVQILVYFFLSLMLFRKKDF